MPNYKRVYETFWGADVPPSAAAGGSPVTVGQSFVAVVAGKIFGARMFRDLGDYGDHMAILRTVRGGSLARVALFKQRAAAGSGPGSWESCYFQKAYPIGVGNHFELILWSELGKYYFNTGYLTAADVTHGNLTLLKHGTLFYNHNAAMSVNDDLNPFTTLNGNAIALDPIFYQPGH